MPLIHASFDALGWSKEAATGGAFHSLNISQAEIIALRMHTGPCFILYNAVLRGMGTGGGFVRAHLPAELLGCSVKGSFSTTIHAINSGAVKLAAIQPVGRLCAVPTLQTRLLIPHITAYL